MNSRVSGCGRGIRTEWTQFSRTQVGLPVTGKERLQWQAPFSFRSGQNQGRIQGDQGWWHVTYGGCVGNIAPQGSAVTDLQGTQALQQAAEGRPVLAQGLAQVGKGGGGADHQLIALPVTAVQFRNPGHADQMREPLQTLGNLKGQVGTSGYQAGLTVAAAKFNQLRQAGRGIKAGLIPQSQAGLAAMVQVQGRIPGRIGQCPGRCSGEDGCQVLTMALCPASTIGR